MKIFEDLKKHKHEQISTIKTSDCHIEDQLEKNGVLTAFYLLNKKSFRIRNV